MDKIFADLKLRATRIGFLVKPSDKKSLRKIIQINTSLWGGVFNPIIPVFKTAPRAWKADHPGRANYAVARGYINYFEPDVFVEAENGMVELLGKTSSTREQYHPTVVNLDAFWTGRNLGRDIPYFGVGINDLMLHEYNTERKFQLREDHNEEFLKYTGKHYGLAASVLFGSYSTEDRPKYISENFDHVYSPKEIASFEAAWFAKFFDQTMSQLSITAFHQQQDPLWTRDITFYIFDPKSVYDLVDVWNMRIEHAEPFIPIPLHCWNAAKQRIVEIINRHFTPINDQGVMRTSTIEISRSLDKEKIQSELSADLGPCQNGSFHFKHWRNRVWEGHKELNSSIGMKISHPYSSDKSINIPNERDGYLQYHALSPKFFKGYSSNDFGWINVLKINDEYDHYRFARTVPFNLLERDLVQISYPDLAIINSEGWCIPQKSAERNQLLATPDPSKVFKSFFEKYDAKIRLSEAGKIALQIYERLTDNWNNSALRLLSNRKTLHFFDKYAMGRRVRKNEVSEDEEFFPLRSIGFSELNAHFNQYSDAFFSRDKMRKFLTEHKIMQLGIAVICPDCFTENWYDLDRLAYGLTCEFCRSKFAFPQHEIKTKSENWKYRLIGPFTSPDYARGSYCALLTLRVLSEVGDRYSKPTFSTGLELTFKNDEKVEADLVCFHRDEGDHRALRNPKLVFAECKSFAKEALKDSDMKQMAKLAQRFPDAAFVFAVLKDNFSAKETRLLKSFINKHKGNGRWYGEHRPIITVTGKDLSFKNYLNQDEILNYSHFDTNSLAAFAHATQQRNLGIE